VSRYFTYKTNPCWLAYVAASLLVMGTGLAQDSTRQPVTADTGTYLQSYWHHGWRMIKSPLRYNSDQWITACGSLAFAGSMIALDEPLNIPMLRWNGPGAEQFGKAGDLVGGLYVQAGITSGALLYGSLAKRPGWINFGLDNLQAQVFSGGVTFLFKHVFHRARPETGADAFTWYGPFQQFKNTSFFSGHTSWAFSTANMIFLHSKKKWWVGVLSFGGATAVGLSRMQQQKHWASDVVMGAIMGTAISTYVYRQQERRRAARQQLKRVL
jgi:membrane-associated phospholipid phosphatase